MGGGGHPLQNRPGDVAVNVVSARKKVRLSLTQVLLEGGGGGGGCTRFLCQAVVDSLSCRRKAFWIN